ncbi:MAG: adenine deaminase [Bacteroidia bacterium]|nr:adenine deaminase [Bacteroidia bacterium]
MKIKSNYVDILNREIYAAEITIENGKIAAIERINEVCQNYALPGFIDAHVHIESSLLAPSEFARMAVIHGTIATVSDPHEIANVLGMDGVEFMISNGKQVPFHFFFGAPSCVPATSFETAGATINSKDIYTLLAKPEILYLAEMMNFPGVLFKDEEVMAKIAVAKKYNKPIDGHAPGLRGAQAKQYIDEGMSTDHECFTLEEAMDKISLGMKVIIREGSAARNFDTLIPLMKDHALQLMFCSDDKHPDSLLLGHINQLVSRAIALGYEIFDVLQVACLNPISHYKLPVGTLKIGDSADFIIVNDLIDFIPIQTFIKGKLVAENGESLIKKVEITPINHFNITAKNTADFAYDIKDQELVIECLDGQLITNQLDYKKNDITLANDVLKLVVVNRYQTVPIAMAFIKNFGLQKGAIASSVAHDSHNIIAVGVNDEEICNAVNLIIANKGGLSAVNKNEQQILPLPIAGLMSAEDAWKVAKDYTNLDNFSKQILGSTLRAPFMSLSFMALLVIPHLKLSDKGLFDGNKFEFC